jgi:hypothetical protein
MTQYEYINLISTLRSEAAGHEMDFFAIWSAYVVVIYLVGRELPRLYAVLVSALYLACAAIPALGFQLAVENQYAVIRSYIAAYKDAAIMGANSVAVPLIVLSVDAIASVAAITFLIHRRRAVPAASATS